MAMTGGTAKLVAKGTPSGWPGPIQLYVYYKEKSQSTENNRTTLSLGMYVTTPDGWYFGPWTDGIGSYVGTATSGSNCKSFNGACPANTQVTRWLAEDLEVTVDHNDDGSKTATIYWQWGVYSTWGHMLHPSGSFAVKLTDIPRASTLDSLSCANDYFTGTMTYKYTPKSAAYYNKCDIALYVNKVYVTVKSISLGKKAAARQTETVTLTAAELSTIYNKLPSATSGKLRYTLTTYSDSDYSKRVGSAVYKELTLTIPPIADTLPAVLMSIEPVGSLPDAFSGLFIQGKTKVKATITAEGKYGASIESYSMKVGGVTYDAGDDFTSGYLSNSGAIRVDCYATDSRGYKGSAADSAKVLPYSKPKILAASGESEVIAVRCDSSEKVTDSGTYLKIKAKRSYSPVMWGSVQKNFCKIRFRYKKDGGSWSAWTTILEGSSLDSDEVETGALLGGALSIKSSYLVQVQAIDDVGGSNSTTIAVPTDKVYWHRAGARRSFTFGGYVEDDNTFAIAEDIIFEARGPVMARGGGNIDMLTLGKQLTASADAPISLNDYKTPGNYYSPNAENSQYIADSPYTAGGFGMTVRELQTTSFIRQEIFYGRTTWIRHFDGADWSDWWRYQTTTVPETASEDYVVQTGVSDGWTYRKWKGGTYEMFGTFEITPTSSTLNGTLYRTNNMTITVPFTIRSAYVSGTAVGYYWITNGGISGDSKITLRLMSDKEFDTTNAIEVRLTVVGTYE